MLFSVQTPSMKGAKDSERERERERERKREREREREKEYIYVETQNRMGVHPNRPAKGGK